MAQRSRRFRFLPRNAWALLLPGLLSLGGCIKREPRVVEDSERAAAAQALEPSVEQIEKLPATGNFGKVEGVDVLGGKGVRAFQVQGATNRITTRWVPVTGQSFSEAIYAKSTELFSNPWDAQIRAANELPIKKGDTLLATIHFRTVWVPHESGEGQTEFVFELARDPWTKSVTHSIHVGPEWKLLYVPFVAKQDFEPGDGHIAFRLGYDKQAVEFGGIRLENFGRKLTLADLPRTPVTYSGMSADAPWRGPAQERIDKIRKAKLTVAVQGANGQALVGANVRVEQKQHAFPFGTAVSAGVLLEAHSEQYNQRLREWFGSATLENDLKWVPLAGEWGSRFTLERANQAIDWLRQADLAVRGHVLVRPAWQHVPKRLQSLKENPEQLGAAIVRHIREVVGATQGKVAQWEVVNEAFSSRDLLEILGDEVMEDWFRVAHQTDPNAKLFISEGNILSGGNQGADNRDYYEKIIRALIAKGAPLDGIAMQGHFGTSLAGPVELLAILDRFAEFQRPIVVSQFDVVVDDEELAARYLRDFYTTLFSHPSVEGLTMWGFWDGSHWKNNAPLFRRDWSLKPAGEAFQKLVHQEWRTDETGESDEAGAFSVRGFLGSYEVTVNVNGQTQRTTTQLGKDGSTVTVRMR